MIDRYFDYLTESKSITDIKKTFYNNIEIIMEHLIKYKTQRNKQKMNPGWIGSIITNREIIIKAIDNKRSVINIIFDLNDEENIRKLHKAYYAALQNSLKNATSLTEQPAQTFLESDFYCIWNILNNIWIDQYINEYKFDSDVYDNYVNSRQKDKLFRTSNIIFTPPKNI